MYLQYVIGKVNIISKYPINTNVLLYSWVDN